MNGTDVRYAAILAAMLPICGVQAAETGTWLGSGWTGEVPHAVRLELQADRGEWRQGAPASCTIPVELAAVDGGRRWYVFAADSSGGACDRLVDGVLVLSDVSGRGATVLDGLGHRFALMPR